MNSPVLKTIPDTNEINIICYKQNQTTTDVPRLLQEWTMTQSIINFHTFLGTLNVPVEDIKRYLVYRSGNPPATSPQPAATPPTIPPAAEVKHSFIIVAN